MSSKLLRRAATATLVVLCLLLALAVPAAPANAMTGTIKGKVADSVTMLPLAAPMLQEEAGEFESGLLTAGRDTLSQHVQRVIRPTLLGKQDAQPPCGVSVAAAGTLP